MNRCKARGWLLVTLLLFTSAGCTYIKSLFPDKERDYQFRTELPELIIPADLKDRGMPSLQPGASVNPVRQRAEPALAENPVVAAVDTAPAQDSPKVRQRQPEPETEAEADVVKEEQTVDSKPVAGSASVSSLQVDQSRSQAWRLVARALSRQKIEIVERNIDRGYFYVKYDPDEVKPSDNSFWDEVDFLFGEDPSNEKEYRISLLEVNPQLTEVTIQNSSGKTLSNRTATHLLKLITDGINMDVPEKAPEKPASP